MLRMFCLVLVEVSCWVTFRRFRLVMLGMFRLVMSRGSCFGVMLQMLQFLLCFHRSLFDVVPLWFAAPVRVRQVFMTFADFKTPISKGMMNNAV